MRRGLETHWSCVGFSEKHPCYPFSMWLCDHVNGGLVESRLKPVYRRWRSSSHSKHETVTKCWVHVDLASTPTTFWCSSKHISHEKYHGYISVETAEKVFFVIIYPPSCIGILFLLHISTNYFFLNNWTTNVLWRKQLSRSPRYQMLPQQTWDADRMSV